MVKIKNGEVHKMKALSESEIERRIEAGHPASVLARLFAVSMRTRLRWSAGEWLQYNPISAKLSPISELEVGGLIGLFIADTARKLATGDPAMEAAIKQPDFASIERVLRVLLTPGSRFLTMEQAAQPAANGNGQPAPPRERPAAPPGARTRHRASRVARV
jgi:hypothetical protein